MYEEFLTLLVRSNSLSSTFLGICKNCHRTGGWVEFDLRLDKCCLYHTEKPKYGQIKLRSNQCIAMKNWGRSLYSQSLLNVVKNNNDSLDIFDRESQGQRNWFPRTVFNQMIDELKINETSFLLNLDLFHIIHITH